MENEYPPLPIAEPKVESESVNVRVQGLGDIPEAWGNLPSNTTLQAELSWVQANRLSIVQETAIGNIVTLSAARAPAPSMAAIGWLETSIRTYGKYIDIVAKSLKDEVHEQENVRRERMAIADIEAILAEMMPENESDQP